MLATNHYAAMEHDELVKLAGEQALLKKQLQGINAEHQRDLLALRNLSNDISHSGSDWHARGVQLLDRIRDQQQQSAHFHQRLREYAKLTGID